MSQQVKENPKKKIQKRYDAEFKRSAVEMVIHGGKPLTQVARELGVSEYSLHLWRKAQLSRMQPAEVDGQAMSPQEMAKGDPSAAEGNRVAAATTRDLKKSHEHPGRDSES